MAFDLDNSIYASPSIREVICDHVLNKTPTYGSHVLRGNPVRDAPAFQTAERIPTQSVGTICPGFWSVILDLILSLANQTFKSINMIDLHCHMLPGIDDGPKSLDISLAMARYAVEHGIKRTVMTPHIQPGSYDNDVLIIQTAYQAFKTALQLEAIPLEIGMSAEVRVCAELPLLIGQNKIPFLGQWRGMKVILLEFPHDHIPLGADKLINWLLGKGILPLIAHPERNQTLMRHPGKIQPFLDLGCILQITADSITGLFGEQSQQCALFYIEQNLATIIATDAHNLHKRQPSMQAARQFLLPSCGEAGVNRLMSDNPARILA